MTGAISMTVFAFIASEVKTPRPLFFTGATKRQENIIRKYLKN
jgi:hypothetical protein